MLSRGLPREDAPAACAMAVMAKASAPGRTKTRLSPTLSAADAANLNTAFLKDIIGNLACAGRDADIAPYVAYGPPGSEPFFRACLPADLPLVECALPRFSECLDQALRGLLERGHRAACVLNSDSPTLPTRLLVQAAHILSQPQESVVIGPSTDGGYYLLGVKRVHRRLFEDIDWSTSRVFAQTLERAAELRLSVSVLEPWYDVDDAAGLLNLHSDLAADQRDSHVRGIYSAPHTRAALAQMTAHRRGAPDPAMRAHAEL